MRNYKDKNQQLPIEDNSTAAWANSEKLKKISNVNKPAEFQIENAKKHVDENKK